VGDEGPWLEGAETAGAWAEGVGGWAWSESAEGAGASAVGALLRRASRSQLAMAINDVENSTISPAVV
jgi:hypothetical protein